jgi:thioredoxin reductase (NADPH)
MHPIEVAVVGAGPAGCAAAVQCRRLGLEVALLDRTGGAGGLVANAFRVENYPSLPPSDGRAVARMLGAHLERWAIPVERGEVSSMVQRDGHFTLEGSFGCLTARQVILAVGTRPVRLGLDGGSACEGAGLFYEVNRLLAVHPRPSRAVVIGGGEAALDYALSLARAGARVTVLVRGGQVRACRRLQELVAAEPAILIRTGTTVVAMERRAAGFQLVATGEDGRVEYRCDATVAALGRRSAAEELLEAAGVGPTREVGTGLPGLFVAGDARLGSLGQVGIAVGDGLLSAMLAAGGSRLER